jgi:hypothetical protein
VSTRRRVTPVPVLVAAALLFAGCATEDESEPAAATGPASSASSSAGVTGTTAPEASEAEGEGDGVEPFPADVRPDEQAASDGAAVTVSDIRVGRHDGFDRVVFEVGGEGTPGWDVRYVDAPVEEGSGNPVDVAGSATLQVLITGAGYPYDTGVEEFSSSAPVTGADTVSVSEVLFRATFEGTTQAFVGTTGEAPFRVYLLEGPTRLVVEVAHPG